MGDVAGIFVQGEYTNTVKYMYSSAPGHTVECSQFI